MKWLTKALTAMRHGGLAKMPFGLGLLARTRFDYRREVGDCLDSSVVTAPVQWVARALPEATLAMGRKDKAGNIEPIPSHKLLDLIQTPNPYYGDIALLMGTIFSFLISGNAYWVIVRNSYGQPVELWYVPHWMIEPAWTQDGGTFITNYLYKPGGGVEPMTLDFDDVVHFRHGIDPRNIRMGISPLDGVIREIFIDLESSNFVASLLRNMGVPSVVISPKGGAMAAPDDIEATKAWFSQAFGGDNRGRPLVMGAPTDVTPYGFNPQQMNMSEGRDVAEERVCACLGIPAAVVGFGAGLQQTQVGATMEELRKLAWSNGVSSFARMLADEIQRSLVPQFGDATGVTVWFDTTDVTAMQEDEDKRVKRLLSELAGGAITVAEYREARGWVVDKSHNVFLRPLNLVEVPVAAARPALPDGSKSALRASTAGYARALAFATALQKTGDAQAGAFEKPLTRLFARFGEEAGAAALPLLEQDPTLKAPQKDRAGDGEKADDMLVQMILAKLGINEWGADLSLAYQGQYLDVDKAVAAEAQRTGLDTSMPDAVARSIIAAGGRRAGLVDLGGQTKDALFQALAEGRAAGEGATALAARITSLVEAGPSDTPQTRARRIARTETKYAQNISTIERGKAAGVDSFVVFDGRLGPGRSTPSHIARNGSIVSADDALTMAEDEHPNGTLSFAPNFEED